MGTMGRLSQLYAPGRIVRLAETLPIARIAKQEGRTMAISPTLEKYLAAPATQRDADAMALKLFCLFSFILVGLITAGIL